MLRRRLTTFLLMGGLGIIAAAPARGQFRLTRYETKYYVILSDLDRDAVRDAERRITLMAEEYHARTKGFAGTIREKLPFYLFARATDYHAAGGKPGSAGLFTGERLMAMADRRLGEQVWRIVQHEGFHQFAYAVIGGDIPIWVNEGLAEYFGDGVFTGEGYVTGVIPPERVVRLKHWLAKDQLRSLRSIMRLTREGWNTALSPVNYEQSWSMVYFLAHADNGKYRQAFDAFMRDISRGQEWDQAWVRHFGRGISSFERKWRTYWENMSPDATADLYAKATVETLTAFLARAFSQRQRFDSAAAFFEAAAGGLLKTHPKDWLPKSLLRRELANVAKTGSWSIKRRPGRAMLVCERRGGTTLTGSFKTGSGRVTKVTVKVTPKPRGASGY